MGQFTQRPEDPTEWAGLPSEPLRQESPAERLADAAPAGLGLAGLLYDEPDAVQSIRIPMPAPDSSPRQGD